MKTLALIDLTNQRQNSREKAGDRGKWRDEKSGLGMIYRLLLRISRIMRMSPLSNMMRKPEPTSRVSGTSVSSEYSNVASTIESCAKSMYAGSEVSRFKAGDSVEIPMPTSRVKPVTNPRTFIFTDWFADTNQANMGIVSVTKRCINNPASSGEIVFALMAEELGTAEAAFWCRRLNFAVPENFMPPDATQQDFREKKAG